MSNEKLGQEPAFAISGACDGMNKRFYAACAAMQGLLTNGVYDKRRVTDNPDVFIHIVVREAYDIADELLKQENQ